MKTFSIVRKMALMLFTVVCVGSAFSSDASAVSTRSTSALAIDPSMGYIVTGLGELKDQVAVVFTNSAAAATWQAPKNLKDVEFLAVGGGGGGGGHYTISNDKSKNQGGAGGGGGAVVTGFINELAANQVVNITVGAGGNGGIATTAASISDTTDAGKGGNGGNTVIKVGDLTYVTAYGGGGDGGYDSSGVANGGSNSGVRGLNTPVGLSPVTYRGEGTENLLSDVVYRRQIGGTGYSGDPTTSGYPSAGGGGAALKGDISDSDDKGNGWPSYGPEQGGHGGYGYESHITNQRVVYGAGGGGGSSRGDGNGIGTVDWGIGHLIEGAGISPAAADGTSGLSNQGGGGGGGSYQKNGGAGGSGVVIFRFRYSEGDVLVDAEVNIRSKIFDKPYTGEVLASGLENTDVYTVEELGERINVGQQTVRVTLNEGYAWADGDTNRSKEFNWNITQEPNNWKVEPSISTRSWAQAFALTPSFKFIAPEANFGVLYSELSVNGASPQPFSGVLPTEPGSYTLRYWVEGTANWAAKEWEVNFTIYRSEAIDGGYTVYGLGEKGDEVAVVFTNHAQTINWTVPANLKGAQFLVVGGGGGGGAESNKGDGQNPGAGGGGGGVVTGLVNFVKGQLIKVTVGAGGAGGTAEKNYKGGGTSNGYGASYAGGASSFGEETIAWVTAKGGGRDQGNTSISSSSNGREGSVGGSGGGGRPRKNAYTTVTSSDGGFVNNDVNNVILYTSYAMRGGKSTVSYAAAGGGGATSVGSDAVNGNSPGNGGVGLYSEITGAKICYGSGGGGGGSSNINDYGEGGPGAGDGNRTRESSGFSALANQGGGGGGGGGGWKSGNTDKGGNGGAGGSGIVVIRYRQFVDIDAIEEVLADRIYTGKIQTIENGSTYTVSGTVSATNAGEYHITLTPRDGYPWSDTETNEPRNFTWRILPASNEWITSVSINTNSWTLNVDVAGVITPPKAQVGEVKAMISKDGAEEKEFDGNTNKIFEPGVYVVTYYPPESTVNFTSENMTPQYVIFEVFINDIIPEYSIHISEPERIGSDRKIVIPYEVTCEAVSDKMLNLYVCYTIVGEGITKTNLVTSIKGVKGSGECEITDLKPGAEYQISFYGDIEGTIQSVEPIITTVVPSVPTDLKVSSVFVNNPMEFRITGSVIPGLGTTVVKVYWALNDASQLEVNAPKQFVFSIGDIITGESGKPNVEVEFGKPVDFTAVIPYTSLSDKLIWKVEVENSLVTDTWGEQTFAGPVKQDEKVRMDAGAIIYTWTGGGTPDENGLYKWADIRNWAPNDTIKECLGYPGTISGTKYQSKAIFTKDAKVDLNGSKMYIDGAIQMSEGISVEISNGTLGFQKTSVNLGAANSILTLKAVKLPLSASKPTDKYTIIPAARSTVVIDGDNSIGYKAYEHLKFSPTTESKFAIKNLDSRTYIADSPAGGGSVVELNNAQWDFITGSGGTKKEHNIGIADKGLANKIIFKDGENRRAVLRSLWAFSWDDDYSKINLNGRTLDIKLKVDPNSDYHNANIMASALSQNANCAINIDVTDYKYTKPVKILTLYSGLGDNELTYTLKVTANGVDVTERVKAKLYWDESKYNLYFSQSPGGTRIIVR